MSMFDGLFGSAAPSASTPTTPTGGLLGGGGSEGWGTAQAILLPLLAGLQEYAGARQGRPGSGMNMLMGLLNAQEAQKDREEKRADRAQQRAEQNAQKSALATLAGGFDPTTGITWNQPRQGMDKQQTMGLLAQAAPEQFAQMQLAKMLPKGPIKLGEGDTLLDPETFQPIASGAPGFFTANGERFGAGGARPAAPMGGTQTVPMSSIAGPLANRESGGDPSAINKQGYAGKYQFGEEAAQAAGFYEPGSDPKDNAWIGRFNIPGMPEVRTMQDFLGNEKAQDAAFDMHRQNLMREAQQRGFGQFIGKTVGGVPITEDALIGMMHLGGPAGTERFLTSNGMHNPADANGTRISDYGKQFGGAGQKPVQVAQANTGNLTDAAPAGPQGRWERLFDHKGKALDIEGNTATGQRRPYEPAFPSNSLEAQALNIVLTRDPSAPEYAAAYAQLTQPKPTPVTMPDGSVKMVAVAPQLPPTIRPPAWMGQRGGPDQGQGAPGAGLSVTEIPGVGGKDPNFSKEQTDAYGFAKRLDQSEAVFRDLEKSGYTVPTRGDITKSQIPMWGNSLVSENFQKFDQAKRNFINAVLRRESGAAISPSEFENAEKQYFPQPGDPASLIEQKRANRETVISSMRASAGGAWDYNNKRAPAPSAPQQSPSASGGIPKPPPGFQIVE